jgi:hypothetical protein
MGTTPVMNLVNLIFKCKQTQFDYNALFEEKKTILSNCIFILMMLQTVTHRYC